MMNPAILAFLSGPLNALARYAIASAATYVATKQWVDGNTITAAAAALTGMASAGIGALTSTRAANTTRVAGIPGAKVTLPNGVTVANKETAAATIASDPTWDNPNAR